ncbi:MAG: hypothetical protein Q8R65_07975 [Polynucleobacter sp.]|nr:hypothetical protein [Polynucleobacter sp.]MDZ4058245.1 hypothetical protein [Polynucleobacter sp.]
MNNLSLFNFVMEKLQVRSVYPEKIQLDADALIFFQPLTIGAQIFLGDLEGLRCKCIKRF